MVLVPIYAAIALLNLVALKMALADNANTANLHKLRVQDHAKINFQP